MTQDEKMARRGYFKKDGKIIYSEQFLEERIKLLNRKMLEYQALASITEPGPRRDDYERRARNAAAMIAELKSAHSVAFSRGGFYDRFPDTWLRRLWKYIKQFFFRIL
ncbi:MAG: hypothetical protein V2G41_09610 [bacterium JZ-2024 1]